MQKTTNIILGAAVIVLAGGLVASFVTRPAPGISEEDVRAIVGEALAAQQPVPSEPMAALDAPDEKTMGAFIEDYLVSNPRILERMSTALTAERRSAEQEMTRIALTTYEDEIFNNPNDVILGNPDGDVTLVEFFDYNCGYCRQVVADVLALTEEDPDLKVILKEFPILSQGSSDAARVGVLVNRQGGDYAAFHTALFSARGSIDAEAAFAAASSIGMNRMSLELDMNTPEVVEVIEGTYTVAQALGISGTPTFIIGDELIPGAVSKAELERRIANMRECGNTTCI